MMKKILTGALLTLFLMAGLQANNNSVSVADLSQTKINATKTSTEPKSLSVKYMTLDTVVFSAEANAAGEDILIAVSEEYSYRYDADSNLVETDRGFFGVPASGAKVGDIFSAEKIVYEEDWWTGEMVESYRITVQNTVLYVGPASDHIVCPMSATSNKIYMFGAFSKGADDGLYSESFAAALDLSPVTLPFSEYWTNKCAGAEYPFVGWNGTKNFMFLFDDYGGVPLSTMTANEDGGFQEAILALPPIDIPADTNLVFSVNYGYVPGSYGYGPEYGDTWHVQDSVVVEVSADGGATFEKIRVIHSQSTTLTYALSNMLIKGYSGKKVILRVRAVSYNQEKAWNIKINDLSVRGTTLCDKPGNLQSSPNGGSFVFSWNPSMNEETEWQVGSAKALPEGGYTAWSEPLLVTKKSYELTGLEDNKLYKFRVRAVCGVGQTSTWVEKEFRSNRVPSFVEEFTGVTDSRNLPVYWKIAISGYTAPTVWNMSNLGFGSNGVEVLNWKTLDKPQSEADNASLAWDLNRFGYNPARLLAMPAVEIDSVEKPKLVLDLAYGKPDSNGRFDILTKPDPNHRLELYVSMDGGKTFSTTEPLRIWDSVQLMNLKDSTHIEVDLSGYNGLTAFAFGMFGFKHQSFPNVQVEPNYLYFDNIGITNMRPVAKALKVTSLASDGASIFWVADKNVPEWLVKLKGEGIDTMFATALHEIDFTGLLPKTDYVASVSLAYAPGDTAAWKSVTFKTGGEQCNDVTELAVSAITKSSALLSWEGEAETYRIRVRPVADTVSASPMEWAYYTTENTSFKLDNLLLETAYEGGVQAHCSQASADTSAYVDFEAFTTLGITCLAPHSLLVVGTPTPNSAVITWAGDAEKYQVEWALSGAPTRPLGTLIETKDTCTIAGLAPSTSYVVRVRSICVAGDTSDWCAESRNFKTADLPECPKPTDLKSEAITTTSAKLSWQAAEEMNGFVLRYGVAAASPKWDSVKDLTATSYELKDLQPKTAYVWSVMNECTDGRYSGWAEQAKFQTEGLGNETIDTEGLYVSVSTGQIHLMNPSAVRIDRVFLYSVEGSLLETYTVRSNENVILTTGVRMKVVILAVESQGRIFRFKTLLP